MKKILIAATMLLASLSAIAQDGLKPLSFPGSNWSNITYNANPIRAANEDINTLLQGNIEQGAVWKVLEGGWKLNTYVSMGYSVDTLGLPWNNKVTPTVGVKFQRPWDNGNLDIGVAVVYQSNFKNIPNNVSSSGTGAQLYMQYWTGWDLRR